MTRSISIRQVNTLGQIARTLGLHRSTLYVLKQRHESFPAPLHDTGTTQLYDSEQVVTWYAERQMKEGD